MTDFIWPSGQDRAECEELDRVCQELEEILDERDALAAHVAELAEALELMVTTHDEGGWPTATIAIARLIAAAPELLEALRFVLKYEGMGAVTEATVRAAIAKATGEVK